MDTTIDKYEIINTFDVSRCYKHEYQYLPRQEGGVVEFGLFEDYKSLITSTYVTKEYLDKNPHVDFYIKNYLEKYLRTILVNHPKHLTKVVGNKSLKKEIYKEDIQIKDNISLITYSEESIINGKDRKE